MAIPVLGSILTGIITFQMIQNQIKSSSAHKQDPTKMSFNGQIKVRQNIAGRLRISAPFLKNREQGHALVVQLSRIDGIHSVGTDYRVGSMLINYDPLKIQDDLLLGALIKLMGIESCTKSQPQSLVTKEIRLANKAANYALLDKTNGIIDLRTLVPLTFIGLAAKEFAKTGNLGAPTPLTLLYWAYTSFGLGGSYNDD